MAYFLNRLKEQASSIQSMAKNIIVYENKDANNECSDDEEVLDQIHDGDDDTQLQGKEVIKSKATTSSTSPQSQPDQSSSTTTTSTAKSKSKSSKGVNKQGEVTETHKSSQSLKDQTDDFFNSFIPNLQAKIGGGGSTGQSSSAGKTIESEGISSKQMVSNGATNKSQDQIKSSATNTTTTSNNTSKNDNSNKQQQSKQSIVVASKQQQNQSDTSQMMQQPIAKSNTVTTIDRKNSTKAAKSYEMEEFEERIRVYQNILKDNEITIENFRTRVITLEQELQNLKQIEQTQSPPEIQTLLTPSTDTAQLTEEMIAQIIKERDEYHNDQMRNMLEVIQVERCNVQERDREIKELQQRLDEISNHNHQLNITNNSKIQDIENILNNLVQTATSQLEQNQKQKDQEQQQQQQLLKEQQQQQQQQLQQQQIQQQQIQNSAGKGKKGKKNQQKQLQQQLEQQMKEKIEQEQQQLQIQQQDQLIDGTQQPIDTITAEQLQQVLQDILLLLKPKQIYTEDTINQHNRIDETLAQLEENNRYLREINLQISDKMLTLEQNYHDKLNSEMHRMEEEYQVKSKSLDDKLEELLQQSESTLQSKLQQERDLVMTQLSAEHQAKLDTLTQEHEHTLTTLKQSHSEELILLKRAQEESLLKKNEELEMQNKSWETNYQKIQEQHRQDSLEIKRHIIGQFYQEMQQALSKVFDLSQEQIKLNQSEDIGTMVSSFSNFIRDNYKSGAAIDPQNIQAMKECWDQVCERFKTFNLNKYTKQSQKDATQWLTQRFSHLQQAPPAQKGKQSSKQQQESFKDSDLYKFYDTQLQTVLSLNQYIQDQATQVTDMQAKRDSIQQQYTKLQKDCNDLTTKQKEIPKLQQKIDQLTQEKEVIQNQLSEVLQQKLDSQMKLEEGRNKTEMLVVENATLKEKVGTLDEDAKRLRKQNKQLQGQLDLQEDFKLQFEKAQQELKWMETQLKSKESEIEESRKTMSVLQRSIQNHQDEYEQNLRLKEREQAEDKQLLQTLQIQNNDMKDKIRETIEIQTKLTESQNYTQQLEQRLEKLEIENQELKKYAQELVEKVKKDSEANEYMVDRRMINKFLVNYVNPGSSRDVKFQMLDSMSRILGFTMEEKQTLGLVKKQTLLGDDTGSAGSGTTTGGQGGQSASQNIQKGIGEKLISFFLQDDDDEE